MEVLQKTKLGRIFKLEYGKSLVAGSRISGEYPVYGSSGRVGLHNDYLVEGPGVIVGRKGTVGEIYFSKSNFYPIDTAYYISKNDKIYNIRFLYYFLKSQNLKRLQGDVGVPGLNRETVHNEEAFFIKDIKKQNKIASALSAYDDLIENNEKRIKILEEMAQLLYTEWFVKFKFPGHEKVKLVDSGTEFGIIPDGWEVKKLSEIGRVITGKTPPTINPENLGGEVLFIKTPDMHGNIFVIETEQTLSEKGVKTQSSKLLPERTVFVSCIGTLGVVGITSMPSQTNQQINSLILNDMSDYCMFYFFAKSLRQKLVGLGSNGATMGNVNKGKFENILIIYPEKRVRSCFFNKTSNLFNEILLLQKRNKNLLQIRDLLIPQLVTGKRELR